MNPNSIPTSVAQTFFWKGNSESDFILRFLFTGFLIYMMRRSAEMMGGGRGGKGGRGLFGGVMESTAKLINSADIGVRFK